MVVWQAVTCCSASRVIVVGNGGIATELVFELENIDVVWAVKAGEPRDESAHFQLWDYWLIHRKETVSRQHCLGMGRVVDGGGGRIVEKLRTIWWDEREMERKEENWKACSSMMEHVGYLGNQRRVENIKYLFSLMRCEVGRGVTLRPEFRLLPLRLNLKCHPSVDTQVP